MITLTFSGACLVESWTILEEEARASLGAVEDPSRSTRFVPFTSALFVELGNLDMDSIKKVLSLIHYCCSEIKKKSQRWKGDDRNA